MRQDRGWRRQQRRLGGIRLIEPGDLTTGSLRILKYVAEFTMMGGQYDPGEAPKSGVST